MTSKDPCPEPQTLARFIEGTLAADEREAVLVHLDDCEECMSIVDVANEVFHDEEHDEEHEQQQPHSAPSRRSWWTAAAAAVVALMVSLVLWRTAGSRFGRPSLARLAAEAPRSARMAEPRLTGGFGWAAYRGPDRATGGGVDEEQMKLSGLAAEAMRAAAENPSAEAQQVAGVAMVLAGQADAAADWLRRAAEQDPNSAAAWSDLAAAEDTAAARSGEASRYPTALAAADRALRLEPRLPEALFNRALILEHLGLTAEARHAWERYLEVDPSSPWAAEAREHLARLPVTNGTLLFDGERPRLERAALAGDADGVLRIVSAHSERSRAYGEGVYLGAWGDAVEQANDAEATRNLTIAKAIGEALAKTSGESLLRDAVRSIERTGKTGDRARLAAAHRQYRRARIEYSQHRPATAEPLLREAAAAFGDSPLALVARYYAASALFDQAGLAPARAELERLLVEASAHPDYLALDAQLRWELALCHTAIDDWSGALPLLTAARATFQRLDERSNLGFIEMLLADTLASAGRLDDAAAARIRSFTLASSEQRADRLPVGLTSAAAIELRTGRRDAARALLALAESAARDAHNDGLLVEVLMQTALLAVDDGDAATALRDAAAARQAAQRIADAPRREWAAAHASMASAAAVLPSSPAEARRFATEAIDFFASHHLAVQLPLCYLLRARSALRGGAEAEAMADLDRGMAAAEHNAIELGPNISTADIIDAGAALYDEAIALALDRGDQAAAFLYTERKNRRRAHAAGDGGAITLAALRHRLAGTNTTVLEIAVLPERLVAFAVSAQGTAAAQRTIGREAVLALVTRSRTLRDDASLRELYRLLLESAEPMMRTSARLVIVADPLLDGTPFAALLDTASQPLVARIPVAMAMTATSLSTVPSSPPRSLLVVALPSGGGNTTAALPEAELELADVAASYGRSTELLHSPATLAAIAAAAPGADIIHIAGHTARPRGNDDMALLLDDGRTASWREISATPLRKQAVVVLAACDTLRPAGSRQSSGISIGAAFLAAGASEVIGTLAPIADRDARSLFGDLHRRLAAGASAAEAVRDAQIVSARNGGAPAWRALSVLTTRIN